MMLVDVDDDDADKVKTIEWRFYSSFVVFLSVGESQTKSKEDDLETTLQFYKKNHPGVEGNLSETAKIIRSLRNLLACGQLASREAFTEADSLFNISSLHREPSGVIVADFLVDVDVPELLTEVLRSFYQKYPNVFSSEEQVGQKNLAEILYE